MSTPPGRFPRTLITKLQAKGLGWEDICQELGVSHPENIQKVRDFVQNSKPPKRRPPKIAP